MPPKKTPEGVIEVRIPEFRLETVAIEIEGTAPLVVGRFSEEAKAAIRDKAEKKAKGARAPRNPEALYEAARYRLPDGRDAASALAFKAAAVEAPRYLPGVGLTMTGLRGMFRVLADGTADDGYPLVAIRSPGGPRCWEAPARNQTGVVDLRYRPRFEEWSAVLRVQFNPALISAAQIANLFAVAGFHIGVGHWRPQSKLSATGHLGTFRVVKWELE